MARCEDWPCCGHELGCCPDYDESGRQLNMKCTCGATVPLNSDSSLCDGCLRRMMQEDFPEEYYNQPSEHICPECGEDYNGDGVVLCDDCQEFCDE